MCILLYSISDGSLCICVCVCVCDSFVLHSKLPESRYEQSLQSQSEYGCTVTLRDEYPECWLAKVGSLYTVQQRSSLLT